MAHPIESQLTMADGTRLFVRDWFVQKPEEANNADNSSLPAVVILHGIAEHCGRYQHVVSFFNSCGISVRTFDHRGHGRSGGKRGDLPHANAIIEDAECVIRDFAQRCQTEPLLFGHSMGGLVAAYIAAAKRVQLRGLILSSPALALTVPRIAQITLKLIAAIVPHLSVPFRLKTNYLSHRLAVFVQYINDPLVNHRFTPILISSLIGAIQYTRVHASELTIPILLLVAGDDKVVDSQGSHDFLDLLPPNLATAHFYSGYYHEVFNEVGADRVFNDLKNWLIAYQFAR